MPCSHIKLPDGTVAIVRHAKRRMPKCRFCSATSSLQCDAIVGRTLGGDDITCDKFICAACARQVGHDSDFCPEHSR